MTYTAPITDMRFAATKLAGFDEIAQLPGGKELSDSLLAHILEEGGRFAAGLRRAEAAAAAQAGVLAPLNRVGDKQGSRLENGVVRNPDGWPWRSRSARC